MHQRSGLVRGQTAPEQELWSQSAWDLLSPIRQLTIGGRWLHLASWP